MLSEVNSHVEFSLEQLATHSVMYYILVIICFFIYVLVKVVHVR